MRLAFVSTNLRYPWGGAEKPSTYVAEAARRAGHEIMLVVTPLVASHPRVQRLVSGGARIHLRTRWSHRRSWGERLRTLGDPKTSWHALRFALSRFRPDRLLLNQGGVFDFLLEDRLLEWCKRRRVPVVLYCHCNSESWSINLADQPRAAAAFAGSRGTIFVSGHNRDWAERQAGTRIANAKIVPNAIEVSFEPPPPWPANDRWCAAVVGRLDAQHKGLDLLIPALAEAWPKQAAWTINFFGLGPDREAICALARRCGLSERVQFHGFVSDLRAVWERNHVLLLPSRYEGCSQSMLEALACGRPVLATNVGGVGDWIEDGINGFVASSTTESSIAAMLERAWAARLQWREMGAAAARLYLQRHDPHPELTVLQLLVS